MKLVCWLLDFRFQNDLTGEHSCVMLKELSTEEGQEQGQWLHAFWTGESPPLHHLITY